ncbi:response regulator transcription factor [Prosthecochloris sp. HL-130-GSB]|jgi:DNA-binding response OmpR family regulator|uniref:Response regulator n=1 Tax=Prosthecochloris aestuarii TaxID=1102 RepID=A0A831WQT1_PROAE|nr:response regulator [Prosthecochloris sp. HL-130-GSB]ARM31222.1 response regulator [Prosthecochloris sp. HL-130-GSB]MBO8092495.1 response regulator [Prosthecochloris sp.]HED30205.1 response regulator [Prosthecochloris aestuarii]
MKQHTILIVDDSANIRRLLGHNLGRNFTVLLAEDAEKALEILSGGTIPDLMVIDVAMPGMDGFSLTEALKKDDCYRSIPLIMLTAKDKSSDKVKGLKLGVDDYITKPFNIEELALRIEKIINQKS